MGKNEAEKTIAVELFKNMIAALESRFSCEGKLKNEICYNKKELNKSIGEDFLAIVNVLQQVVDKFYADYFVVDKFMPFELDDFDVCLSHNKSVLKSIHKLMRFIA